MNLKKVAEIANVSVSTASKALKNSFDVSEETRRRVISAAEKCGYFSEKKKVSAENKKSTELAIAVLCPEVISPYYSTMVESISAAANGFGYSVIVYNIGFDKAHCRQVLASCFDDTKIDAVINLSAALETEQECRVPYVELTKNSSSYFSNIDTELKEAFCLLKEQNPHWQRVCFASEGLTGGKEELFLQIFPSAEIIVGSGRFEEAGESTANKLLAKETLPEAVVCAYDEIAYGLIATFEKNGISVPEDIEVVGINDIRTSRWFFGGLSTISFNYEDLFTEILADITEDLKNKKVTPRKYVTNPTLIKRGTTK